MEKSAFYLSKEKRKKTPRLLLILDIYAPNEEDPHLYKKIKQTSKTTLLKNLLKMKLHTETHILIMGDFNTSIYQCTGH
jgi:exonuclease III